MTSTKGNPVPKPDESVATKAWEKPRIEDVVIETREDVLGSCYTSTYPLPDSGSCSPGICADT